ncbi:DUF368 domain-containing protein [Myxococcota bacterium]|nr:DUF368 domain-containing protein [Myxococcota bacterium]MBU1535567.1 DUF368 domain-containing protein [Myxococcota bacterium]
MNINDSVMVMLKGALMGAADVIPGVSGGTMAFITGIYGRLIDAINSVDLTTLRLFFTGKFRESFARIHFRFIIPLVIGVFFSVFTLARVITRLLESHPVELWSFFFGLIAASIWVVLKEVKEWSLSTGVGLVGGAVGAWFIVGMIPVSTPNTWWFTIIAGIVSIIAMVLPGISGSFILVLISQYRRIMEAVKSLDLETLGFFYIGTMIGIIGFARVLGWLLKHHRALTLAILSGFMVGSMRKIWPYKEVLESTVIHGKTMVLKERNILPQTLDYTLWRAVGFAVVGLIVVITLEYVANSIRRKDTSQ